MIKRIIRQRPEPNRGIPEKLPDPAGRIGVFCVRVGPIDRGILTYINMKMRNVSMSFTCSAFIIKPGSCFPAELNPNSGRV